MTSDKPQPESLGWMVFIPTGALSPNLPKWMGIGFPHPTAEAASVAAQSRPGARVVELREVTR